MPKNREGDVIEIFPKSRRNRRMQDFSLSYRINFFPYSGSNGTPAKVVITRSHIGYGDSEVMFEAEFYPSDAEDDKLEPDKPFSKKEYMRLKPDFDAVYGELSRMRRRSGKQALIDHALSGIRNARRQSRARK